MNRLLSLDAFRGVIMVLLMLESTRFYDHVLDALPPNGLITGFFTQFTHHPWNGLRFWDLIQPGFMFIAGTAMAMSLMKQEALGISWNDRFLKILKRSGWLFFWGVLDYAVRDHGLSFELWDVLTQLCFTTLVAFLVFGYSLTTQIAVSVGLLLLTELLYRFSGIPGFDQPFTDQHNFGNYVDLLLMNKVNSGGWVAINCIPTAAHTIWGAVAGRILMDKISAADKVRKLAIGGAVILVAGFLLDWTSVTPIIKRIATSSFTLASGGCCLLFLAAFYWRIDHSGRQKGLSFFTTVGMNSLFIYLFFEIVASRWFNGYITAIVT
ncbi:MAG: acyltransferase family protein, partial [Bacteroidota bacterium]